MDTRGKEVKNGPQEHLKEKIYCHFRVCFALPNVFWQTVFLQHCLAVKCVKESSLGCCARQEL